MIDEPEVFFSKLEAAGRAKAESWWLSMKPSADLFNEAEAKNFKNVFLRGYLEAYKEISLGNK